MLDFAVLLLMFTLGAGLGVLYFAGLWKTLDSLSKRRKGWTWRVFGSFLIRAGALIGVFFLLMRGDWRRLVALLAGFLLTRSIFLRRMKRKYPATQRDEPL